MGPRTVEGVVVLHSCVMSEVVGAAGLPAICGGGAVACAVPLMLTPTVSAVTRVATPRITPLSAPLIL